MDNNESIQEFILNISKWFKLNEYKGLDPYQLDEKASGLIRRFPFLKYVRKLLKPFHALIPKSSFSSFPKIYHPKALGLIIGGNSLLFKLTGNKDLLEENYNLLNILRNLRNRDYKHLAWGSPFEWGSKPRYLINTPAVCLISPIGNAILDFYEASLQTEVLDFCKDISLHILNENGYKSIDENTICLYYSPVDKNEVYNSNALAAKFLFRLSNHLNDIEMKEIAEKITNYVLTGQNIDGSWVYSDSSDVIDNRHTGFILESLASIRRYYRSELIERAYGKGLAYYMERLMDNGLPRWSPEKTYPIDIHDVAQSVITFTEAEDLKRANYIANFAIENMSNGKDEFYFKFFKSGKVNKNVFIRWGQAWMYYALTKLMVENEKDI